mmetsp:Transcript_58117/g.115213  ORF Transcript_58117/g.115213 Transcript_58117/m.115213 type:complete len:273 (+) Transcript_58117:60-878(+)
MPADGAALLAAAVRAACLAKAPRRTVQAVAEATDAAPATDTGEAAGRQRAAAPEPGGSSAEELLAALRQARAAQRRRKKERRRAKRPSSPERPAAQEAASAAPLHQDLAAGSTQRFGGEGVELLAGGSPPREPPCKIPRVDIRGGGETPHVPPLPAIENGLIEAALFSPQVQVAGPCPADWENLPPGLTEELAKYGIVDYSRSHDSDGKPCFQYSDTRPVRPASIKSSLSAEGVIKAVTALVESRSGHEGERVAGTPETGKTRPRKRAGKKR